MKEIINNLDKMVVYIEDEHLYAINKNHTLIMRFRLKKKYPQMCFSTNKWVKDSEFEAVRDDYILFRNGNSLIKIPTTKVNLKEEYESLAKKCTKSVFTLNIPVYRLIQKHKDDASFFKLDVNGSKIKIILYDTSKDRTIETAFNLLSMGDNKGTWYLPTNEINNLYNLGFDASDVKVSDDGNYFLVDDKNSALVSSMKVIT